MNQNETRVINFMANIPSQAATLRNVPTPPEPDVRVLRARLMLEECFETIEKGLGLNMILNNPASPIGFLIDFEDIEFEIARPVNMVELADGLADQEFVCLGTAASAGIDHQPIYDIVTDNNDDKLITGTVDAGGKLIKHPDHPSPAPLIHAELVRQGWEPAE